MVNIDPNIQPLTIGKKKENTWTNSQVKLLKVINKISFEIDSSNKILWLYKPKAIVIK